ncbi:hypothetical protein [Tepidibacter formicigenes]|jgi:hypothetical protein|uniref:Uncharacterized protein n=1 Tax=Tepidibacter formicigenes DSM 15518 TaxID=1123349 RepID=A0A1M6JBM9_9FIRM|nr:hypothetical protein [Tepidibacter formicigenes]SHJ44014.1 hypothetical protein SAMN02744037_00058 [Tepidibacter formicigenes DSM 15518]
MNINYVIILIGFITCIISLSFLVKFSSRFEHVIKIANESKSNFTDDLVINKLNELDKNIKIINNNIKNETSVINSKNLKVTYSNEIERLSLLGYSKEEIAKMTNKSIREVDLILKLKRE